MGCCSKPVEDKDENKGGGCGGACTPKEDFSNACCGGKGGCTPKPDAPKTSETPAAPSADGCGCKDSPCCKP